MSAAPPAAARWWLPVACAALLLLTWGGVLRAPFVADDLLHAGHALGADRDADLLASLTGSWHGRGPPFYYRPLAVLSFALDGALWGAEPFGWHLTSFLLFLAMALLLAGAGRAVFLRLGVEAALATRASTIAALVFCVLPSQLEAIAWISNRDGPLATVLCLAALWLRARRHGALSVPALAFALCAKETAVMWVPLLVALDALYARRERPARALRETLRAALLPLLLLLVYFAARHAMFGTFGAGRRVVFSYVRGEGGLQSVAANVVAWLGLFPWPVGSDLLGGLALPAGLACTALALAPWLLAWCDPRMLRRRALLAAAAGGVLVALLLLGPVLLVAAGRDDLHNTRFVPLLALPLCAASGLAWAAALGGRFRAPTRVLLVLLLAVHIALGALHAAAFALVAGDLQHARSALRTQLADGSLAPSAPGAPLLLALPLSRDASGFTLRNGVQDLLQWPGEEAGPPIRALTPEEYAAARVLPEFAAQIEAGSYILPHGTPPAPDGLLQRLAERLRRYERLGLGAPLLVRREQPASLRAPDPGRPFEALDVAALQVPGHGGTPPALLRVAWIGTRGSGAVEFPCVREPAIVPLETEAAWLSAGTVTSLVVSSRGSAVGGVVPLKRLPAIRILEPSGALVLRGDPGRPLEIVFRPPFPCERYRFHVTFESGLLGDTFEASRLPADADGALHLRFEDGLAGGRRSTIDWRFVQSWARGARARWFVEGLDGTGAAARVVARSPVRIVTVR